MQNILFDINIILDFNCEKRDTKFPDSRKAYELAKAEECVNIFLSSSSLDNIEFLKYQQLSDDNPNLTKKQRQLIAQNLVKELLQNFKIAKTPAYIEIDFEDIEDSQIISSAKAINGKVITRDKGMLKKHPNIATTAEDFLRELEDGAQKIDFANLKKQYFDIQPKIEQQMDDVLEGFYCELEYKQKYIPQHPSLCRSIITIKISPYDISVVQDGFDEKKIRVHFTDGKGKEFSFLSITDLGFHNYAENNYHRANSYLDINNFFKNQDEIFLRVGLSRNHIAKDGREGYWIQINGIYTFPDFNTDIRSY